MEPDRHIQVSSFNYDLPHDLIAQYPLQQRDQSRLLVFRGNKISESIFRNIAGLLPDRSLLIFNNTKVIRARLIFSRETGSTIEIFCLEPHSPVTELQQAFDQTGQCTWTCLVGNVKRWKNGFLRKHIKEGVELRAELKARLEDGCFLVEFSWNPRDIAFSVILEMAGHVPLPPYIERPSDQEDSRRYQTIFAENDGSVAAPTAGLHFTPDVINDLETKEIETAGVTLHVGLGTFRPVSAPDISEHVMHSEKIIVHAETIRKILEKKSVAVTAVGTTSVRTLESIYWAGVKISMGLPPDSVGQWDPYSGFPELSAEEALRLVSDHLEKINSDFLTLNTSLMIIPGYRFHITDILITNFHQPQSTLLLLVSAFIGENWRNVYNYAVEKRFRFLSYGDACLFFRH